MGPTRHPDTQSAIDTYNARFGDGYPLPELAALIGDDAVVMLYGSTVLVIMPDADDDGVEADMCTGYEMALGEEYESVYTAVEIIYTDLARGEDAEPISPWTFDEAEEIVSAWSQLLIAAEPTGRSVAEIEATLRHDIDQARIRMGLFGLARSQLHATVLNRHTGFGYVARAAEELGVAAQSVRDTQLVERRRWNAYSHQRRNQ